jgi:hypothetical protein
VECIGHRGSRIGFRPLALLAGVLALASVWMLVAARPADAVIPPADSFPDRVIPGPLPAARSAPLLPVAVPGGGSISVQVDPAYAGGGALQRVLNSLAELPHGPRSTS